MNTRSYPLVRKAIYPAISLKFGSRGLNREPGVGTPDDFQESSVLRWPSAFRLCGFGGLPHVVATEVP